VGKKIVARLDDDVENLLDRHADLHGSKDKWVVNNALKVFLTLRLNKLPELRDTKTIETLIKKVLRK